MFGTSCDHGKYNYYVCRHRENNICSNRINADELHKKVKEAVSAYLTPDKTEELALAAYREYESENQFPGDSEILKKRLETVQKKINNIVNAIADGFANEELKINLSELTREKADIKEQLEKTEMPSPKFTYEQFHFAINRIVDHASSGDFKKLLDTVVNCIIIQDKSVVICMNLTDQAATPPLEQVMFKVSNTVEFS